jgi:copper chaperone CopZ
MKSHSIFVDNLKCGGCANTIRKEVSKFSSVQQVSVDKDLSRIDIEFNTEENQLDEIKRKLLKIGYPEQGTENTKLTAAKSYVSCAIGRMGV